MLHNIEKITPKIADQYLKINTRNRHVSKSQLGFLIREMEKGNWWLNGSPIVFGTSGKLLDGQHRLTAISKTGEAQEMLVVRDVDDAVFVTLDSGRGRTGADAFQVAGIHYPTVMAAAVRKILDGYTSTRVFVNNATVRRSNTELLDFFLQHQKDIESLHTLVRPWCNKGAKVVVPTDAIALLFLLRHESDVAYEFIEEVASGSYEGRTNTTVQTLRNKLIRCKSELGGSITSSMMKDFFLVSFRNFINGVVVNKIIVRKIQTFHPWK